MFNTERATTLTEQLKTSMQQVLMRNQRESFKAFNCESAERQGGPEWSGDTEGGGAPLAASEDALSKGSLQELPVPELGRSLVLDTAMAPEPHREKGKPTQRARNGSPTSSAAFTLAQWYFMPSAHEYLAIYLDILL